MTTEYGSNALNKFQTFEGSQYFSPKNSLLTRFQRKEE